MNSFNTDEDTEKVLRKYKNLQIEIHTFNQSCYPRINRDTLLPIAKTAKPEDDLEAWYPPGHGDFYRSFQNSGLLRKFLEQVRNHNRPPNRMLRPHDFLLLKGQVSNMHKFHVTTLCKQRHGQGAAIATALGYQTVTGCRHNQKLNV